ncbi:uncharacterized protein A4U43_C10F13160 [Asparagus officinalis]|uniref:Uncharacterized protein n=1 Tax=Asparagus officinalis TaxID=4686 RepID=A0A5P1E2G7_ASPOF|nr:uncharacterized protein A4U43_C10F13160 [Asparagus officinalis]
MSDRKTPPLDEGVGGSGGTSRSPSSGFSLWSAGTRGRNRKGVAAARDVHDGGGAAARALGWRFAGKGRQIFEELLDAPKREQEVAKELARAGERLEKLKGPIAEHVQMPAFAPNLPVLLKQAGEGHTATALEPSLGVTPSVAITPSATEFILPASAVVTEPIPSTSEAMTSTLVTDQQVLAQSTQPIISKGTMEAAIIISSAEEEKEEEEVDYSGDSNTIVDDVFRDYASGLTDRSSRLEV